MIIGLDMGGTHTDVALLENGEIYKKTKYPRQEDFLESILIPLDQIMEGEDPLAIERVLLSTTLSTNAIVEGKLGKVGMVLEPGPGLNLDYLNSIFPVCFISGYIDHRGREKFSLDMDEVRSAGRHMKEKGAQYLGIVGKFSTRNPLHEKKIYETIGPSFSYSTLGHTLSGNLNYPRRIYTSYLNSGVWEIYKQFLKAIKYSLGERKIKAPLYILKADGGTLAGDAALLRPVETVLSGPAASIMGAMALEDIEEDGIILDIGGTTTDIAFLADGVPLFEPRGIEVSDFKTLIRGLYSRPCGVGGDSLVELKDGQLKIGPERLGPAAAFGGSSPTPTDAMVIKGIYKEGSRSKAIEGLKPLADKKGVSVEEMADMIYEKTADIIVENINRYLGEVNSRPVYTIHELLHGKKLAPQKVILVGAPAPAFAEPVSKKLGIPCILPEGFEAANALGAALSRVTTELTVVADTQERTLVVGEEGIREKIPSNFSKKDAEKVLFSYLRERCIKMGGDPSSPMEIIEEEEFNVVRGFYTSGKIIRLKGQIKPGIRGDYGA